MFWQTRKEKLTPPITKAETPVVQAIRASRQNLIDRRDQEELEKKNAAPDVGEKMYPIVLAQIMDDLTHWSTCRLRLDDRKFSGDEFVTDYVVEYIADKLRKDGLYVDVTGGSLIKVALTFADF